MSYLLIIPSSSQQIFRLLSSGVRGVCKSVPVVITFVYIMFFVGSLEAQTLPNFVNPGTVSTSVPPLTGVSLVSYHTNQGDILLTFYTDGQTGELSYAQQTDATQNSFAGSTAAGTNTVPEHVFYVDQSSPYGESTSGVSTAIFNNNLYVGYVEAYSHQFVVLQAQMTQTNPNQFFFTEFYRDPTAGALTTAAGAAVQNGSLVFVYGTTRNPNLKNEAWTTWLDSGGTWHSQDAGMDSPSQPGLASFNGTLYMVNKQNNSNNGIFINVLDNTGHYSFSYQINGGNVYWRTPFGFSMMVWNNELIFAADGQGGGSPLCIYASQDGANWVAQSYPGINFGHTPSITLFDGVLTAAGQTNGSRYNFTATHAY